MGKTHVIFSDAHAHPAHHNHRAGWLGKLILDLRPDVVINLGDLADMPSLSSYDKGTKGFQGRTYKADIDTALDFQERLWHPIKQAKRRRPRTYWFDGNHEHRTVRAVNQQSELEGTVSCEHIQAKGWDVVVGYDGLYPGVHEIDGVSYGHYMVSGVMGRPIGGERHAATLVAKKLQSCTVGHTHVFDFHLRPKVDGTKAQALVMPAFMDYECDWAGQSGKMWSKGLVIKRNVEGGMYDMEYVSIERLEKEYGTDKQSVGPKVMAQKEKT
jgi:3',5'-cyclic AMP phosphodiesterase CpdA